MINASGSGGGDVARECLFVMKEIIDRALSTSNPNHSGYAIEELTQVLLKCAVRAEGLPDSPGRMPELPCLLEELEFVDFCLQWMITQTAS